MNGPYLGTLGCPEYAVFFEEHAGILEKLAAYDLSQVVSSVAGLLTSPEWQASTLRLEVLQHMAVATARGNAFARPDRFHSWLTELGNGTAGRGEDPPEDVFASRVLAAGGNYLVFDGLDETAAFRVQRFLDVLEGMPSTEPFASARRSILSLLRLSDEVARRSGVVAFMTGETTPLTRLPRDLVRLIPNRAGRVVFSLQELEAMEVSLEDLGPFLFDTKRAEKLILEMMGSSSLERAPVILGEDKVILALPTAVPCAIRRFVIEFCAKSGFLGQLGKSYVHQFATLFEQTPLVGGGSGAKLFFQEHHGIYCANVTRFVDRGRVLHLCFVVDNFKGFEEDGMSLPNPESDRISEVVQASIIGVYRDMSQHDDFKDAISLVVGCSWGRPVVVGRTGVDDSRWRIETISAADLETLSLAPSFEPLSLWRLLDSKDQLKRMGLNLFNQNGLINLQGWANSLGGHLVAHERLPDDHDPSRGTRYVIPSNCQVDLRRHVWETRNRHYATTWDGRRVHVRRELGEYFFDEDRHEPLYWSEEDAEQGRLAAVCETVRREWWVSDVSTKEAGREYRYQLFHALTVWLKMAAPILDARLPGLPDGPLGWLVEFEDTELPDPKAPVPDRDEANGLLVVAAAHNTIRVSVGKGFLSSFRAPTNMGEVLLLETLIRGANVLAGKQECEGIDELKATIVPNEGARDCHFFEARQFRDFVHASLKREPVLIAREDSAFLKLGLGWRVRDRRDGAWIRGVEECCKFLGLVIDSIWSDLREVLARCHCESLIMRLIENHESAMVRSDRWRRTARAVLSLHRDTAQTEAASIKRLSELDSTCLGARLLVEMALCECPESGGEEIGDLDLARLQSQAIAMHTFGGWSEAIKYGAKEAKIKLSPLGEILTEPVFDDSVVAPYGQELATIRIRHSASTYEESFSDEVVVETARSVFPGAFWTAWQDEFGFSIDDLRVFLDQLEKRGVDEGVFAFTCTQEEFSSPKLVGTLEAQTVERILDVLTLRPRVSWNSTPSGYLSKDWYPWRFRRRLSLICRPIVQLPGAPRRYVVAPGVVRDSAKKLIQYCFEGGLDAASFPQGKMRSWIGAAENKRGHEFNRTVASRLKDLGWQVRSDIKLTEILNAKLDRDYGDIDVLAWREDRMLAIECKDLELAMTIGEIARQVHEFRGEDGKNGKPDRLKKHMDRVAVLRSRISDVRRYTKSPKNSGVETCLVFSNLVPMKFSDLASRLNVVVALLDTLDSI